MCETAKASVTAWWIIAIMALFLWYRDQHQDRALAVFVLALGLIQLIEYGIHSGADPHQAGRALFLTLWLQCLVLAIGVWIFLSLRIDPQRASTGEQVVRQIAGWNLVVFACVFLTALVWALFSGANFWGAPGASGHIEWSVNGGSLMGRRGWLYLVGIFLPLFLLLAYKSSVVTGSDIDSRLNVPLVLLILYGIGSALYVHYRFPAAAQTSEWCYLAVGFAFLVWFLGIYPDREHPTC